MRVGPCYCSNPQTLFCHDSGMTQYQKEEVVSTAFVRTKRGFGCERVWRSDGKQVWS
jgi:hypothetical protein